MKTLKRDNLAVTRVQDSQTVLGLMGDWIEDHNENHPHLGAENVLALQAHHSSNRNRLSVWLSKDKTNAARVDT